MLRVATTRSSACLKQGLRAGVRRQWQPQRIRQPLRRTYADNKPVDKAVIPGSQTSTVAGVPTGPISHTVNTTPTAAEIPRTPPSPAEVQSKTPAPSTTSSNLPPTGPGTASTSSSPPPPPRKPRRRFRNFILSLFILSALGYAGGVYYSLVSDNWHDFFTEYVPFGEDAVAYFEEREFRKRFPTKEYSVRSWPQRRGEQKVTIGRQSGLQPKVAETENTGSDLAQRGRHSSAVTENKAPAKEEQKPPPEPSDFGKATSDKGSGEKKTQVVDKAKTDAKTPEPPKQQAKKKTKPETKPETKPAAPSKPKAEPAPAPTPATPLIDNINIPEGSEPVVQNVITILNNIITAVNESPDRAKYSTTLAHAKDELKNVINNITTLKDLHAHDAETKIQSAHSEFDEAARELVRRVEGEMKEQEMKWRDEYETEREQLSSSYQQKLAAELDAAKQVAEAKEQNALLEQEIVLQKSFMDSVKSQVETERSGRLSKLDELSTSVAELEKLTGDWNNVVDATLSTQHLQVALEAVRAKVHDAEAGPSPFLNELIVLKEVSKDNDTVTAAIASINPVAYQRGIPSISHLIDRFRRVASEVRKASLLPEDAGVASHAASAVLSRFMFTKKSERGLPQGEDVEATLARTEVLLEEGDLDAAAREMNGLKGWAGVLSRDWVAECRRVLEVRQAVDVIATEARLQSLLVE